MDLCYHSKSNGSGFEVILSNGKIGWLAALVLSGGAGFCWAQESGGSSSAATGLLSTKHNLSGREGVRTSRDSREVCVFCHTPTADMTAGGEPAGAIAPAWQPSSEKVETGFATYDDIGRQDADGRSFSGSQSFACLSCHDATQALGITNLTFDHPYGVPYRGAYRGRAEALALEQRLVSQGDTPYKLANAIQRSDEFKQAISGQVGGRQQWWVPTSTAGVKTRADLPLYPRQSDTGEMVPFIECGSCHDPHMASEMFLRINPQGSQLCLTCHTK